MPSEISYLAGILELDLRSTRGLFNSEHLSLVFSSALGNYIGVAQPKYGRRVVLLGPVILLGEYT